MSECRTADLHRKGTVFRDADCLYRTTGEALSQGGMGYTFIIERLDASGQIDEVVGKLFHEEYLYQLRNDDITRRDHKTNLSAIDCIAQIDHPNLLPVYISAPIKDNHLLITPRKADTLLGVTARRNLSPRHRVRLLMQALEGLGALHEYKLIHRDFTLRNILVDDGLTSAYLFDFDLSLSLDVVAGASYNHHYKGRIYGSPGCSVGPELVDEDLLKRSIAHSLDIYAIGGALYGLFTDQSPYGRTDDLWGLLMRVADGLVFNGDSRVEYPDEVPRSLRPIIERCLERNPDHRFSCVGMVLHELDQCLDGLDDFEVEPEDSFCMAVTVVESEDSVSGAQARSIPGAAGASLITPAVIDRIGAGLLDYGYRVERCLGQVKERPIFLAVPHPELLAAGQFPYSNTYPKLVTAIDLKAEADIDRQLDLWFGCYLPVLELVRQGAFTTLHKAIHHQEGGFLFLFSEFVDDPRFGTDLEELNLTLIEALGLAFLVVRQVGQLHERGLAHNNVSPASLLFKGVRTTRDLLPSMAGLVQPSLSRDALADDVRQLAHLVRSWLRPARIEAAEIVVRTRLQDLYTRLTDIAFDEGTSLPGIDELFAIIANTLSCVDHNFKVLRENRGDLQNYLLLQISHRLYGRLWTDS